MFTENYRLLNKQLHEQNANYGTTVKSKINIITDIIDNQHIHSVLDYGCGKGLLKQLLIEKYGDNKLFINEYDIAFEQKLSRSPSDLIVCSDVMEHVEPEYTKSVLQDIELHTLRYALFVISTKQSDKTFPDGRNTHINIKGVKEWSELIGQYFEIDSQKFIPTRSEVQFICKKRFK